MKILSLQPYYGGSHRQFNDGWVRHSAIEWTTLGLPARHWKWRMRHAAVEFAQQVKTRHDADERWDAIVCSDMLNVAEFRGLAKCVQRVPLVVYFHENQFAYPNQNSRAQDQHFPFTNFTSALAADQVWFNSQFNRDSMRNGLNELAARWPDHSPNQAIAALSTKAEVHHPGIEVPTLDWATIDHARQKRIRAGEPLHLLWAARWEHDKNPNDLLAALQQLRQRGVPFRVSVIGQQFANQPKVFQEIHDQFENSIESWGYQPERESYWQALARADVFLSTATHEFFGLAAAEAIAAGVWPLLPNRLAYPELLRVGVEDDAVGQFMFDGTAAHLAKMVENLHTNRDHFREHLSDSAASKFRKQLSWQSRAATLDIALANVVDGNLSD